MVAESIRTDTIANNLANVNTTGFKRDVAINKNFADMLIYRINDGEHAPYIGNMGLGTAIDEIGTIHSQGALTQTGSPLNLAIEGKGFFTVQTPNGMRYTRDGTFSLNHEGQLVTMGGHLVLGQGGPIQIGFPESYPARITIDLSGAVYTIGEDGEPVAAGILELASFVDERQLVKQGYNLYNADNVVGGPQRFEGRVVQGYLEQSNANVISDMVNLIATYRAYEINAKAIQSQDELVGKAVNEVGKI
jgi:flagellar basal-body rod protein FlgG